MKCCRKAARAGRAAEEEPGQGARAATRPQRTGKTEEASRTWTIPPNRRAVVPPALLFLFVRTMILASYMVYRRQRPHLHKASRFRMPGGVPMCRAVLAFCAFILWALTRQPDTRRAPLVTPIWFAALGPAWMVLRRRPRQLRQYEAFRRELAKDGGSFQARPASRG